MIRVDRAGDDSVPRRARRGPGPCGFAIWRDGVRQIGPAKGEPLAAWGQQGALADIKVLPPSRHSKTATFRQECQRFARRWRSARLGGMNGLDLLGPEHRGLFIGGTWRDSETGQR